MSKRGPKIKTPLNSRGGPVSIPFPMEAPAYLSDRARAEYGRLMEVLDLRGLLSATDPRLVELYAMNYDVARLAYDKFLADSVGRWKVGPR